MNRILSPVLFGLCALLSACSDGNPELVSPQKTRSVLDMLKGPTVDGVDKTLLVSAESAAAEGNYPRAVSYYQQIIDRSPDKLELQLAMANVLRKADTCNDALVYYEGIIKKEPKNADALEGKGLCMMALGESRESGQIFTQVLEIDPKRWRTLNAVGVLFAGKGKVDEAIAYFERAASVDSMQIAIMNNLGLAYMLDKRYDQAIEVFIKAQKRLPSKSIDKPRIDMNLALAYALSGDMDNAQKFASPHVSDAGLYNNMGFFAKLAKDETLARDYLNMALSKSPVYYQRAWENLDMVRKNAHGSEIDSSHGVRVQTGTGTRIKVKPSAEKLVPTKSVAAKKEDAPKLEVITPVAEIEAPVAVVPPVAEIAAEEPAVAAATGTEIPEISSEEAEAELATAKSAEARTNVNQWKSLTPRSDEMLRAPESQSLQLIEPPEESRLGTKEEGWME